MAKDKINGVSDLDHNNNKRRKREKTKSKTKMPLFVLGGCGCALECTGTYHTWRMEQLELVVPVEQ